LRSRALPEERVAQGDIPLVMPLTSDLTRHKLFVIGTQGIHKVKIKMWAWYQFYQLSLVHASIVPGFLGGGGDQFCASLDSLLHLSAPITQEFRAF